MDGLRGLLADAGAAGLPHAPAAETDELAELALALTRGLEADPAADEPLGRLRRGVALLVAGLTAASPAGQPS